MDIRIFQKGFNFSQDGPGNRLVYHLQGCNMRCPWCANPEGLSPDGTSYPLEQVVEEIGRSSLLFFDGGGITLTGGEATMQFAAVTSLLQKVHEMGIHTCIETNGTHPLLPRLFPWLDLLIMDVKHYDDDRHRTVTGVSCAPVFQNITSAIDAGKKLALRIPLIGGFNASEEDARQFAQLFEELDIKDHATIELLCYHEYGKDKYAALNMPYTMDDRAFISAQSLQAFSDILSASGFTLIHT